MHSAFGCVAYEFGRRVICLIRVCSFSWVVKVLVMIDTCSDRKPVSNRIINNCQNICTVKIYQSIPVHYRAKHVPTVKF